MLFPDMMDSHFKDCTFEYEQGSGVVVVMVDDGQPVHVSFRRCIKLRVVFDIYLDSSKAELDKNAEDDHSFSQVNHNLKEAVSNDFETRGATGEESSCQFEKVDQIKHVYAQDSRQLFKRKHRKSKTCKDNEEIESPKVVTTDVQAQAIRNIVHEKKKERSRSRNRNFAKIKNADNHISAQSDSSELSQEVRAQHVGVRKSSRARLPRTDQSMLQIMATNKTKQTNRAQHSPNKRELNSNGKCRKLLLEKVTKCEFCSIEFQSQQAFYDHRKAEESEHTCGICGKVEPYQAYLIVHMEKHRRGKLVSSDQKTLNPKTGKKKYNKISKCAICGLEVSSADSLKIHMFLHTGEHPYRCCVCSENFSSLSSRQHHMETHILTDRFQCRPCGQRFSSRTELWKHKQTHEIKCSLCGQVFPNKTSRTCHLRTAHPGEVLRCSVCPVLCASQQELDLHLLYHKKGKREQCPVCGLVVSRLKGHMAVHNQTAQDKHFACDQCPVRYLRKSNLDRHMRIHTGEKPYACNNCSRSFRSNGMLRKHLLTHTKEKPFECEVCGKRMALRSNLRIHARIHMPHKVFQCTLCSQAFNHMLSLRAHIKNKHDQARPQQHRRMSHVFLSQLPDPNLILATGDPGQHKNFSDYTIPAGLMETRGSQGLTMDVQNNNYESGSITRDVPQNYTSVNITREAQLQDYTPVSTSRGVPQDYSPVSMSRNVPQDYPPVSMSKDLPQDYLPVNIPRDVPLEYSSVRLVRDVPQEYTSVTISRDIPQEYPPLSLSRDIPLDYPAVSISKNIPETYLPVRVPKDIPQDYPPVSRPSDIPVDLPVISDHLAINSGGLHKFTSSTQQLGPTYMTKTSYNS